MECAHAAGLLPWLLNGTLEEGQHRELRRHLAACAACAAEMDETRAAWALAAGHLPADTLVDYVFATPPAAPLRALVEEHVAACAACAGELDLVRASREAMAESDVEEPRTAFAPRAGRASAPTEPAAPGPATSVTPIALRRPARVGPGRVWRYGALAASLAAAVASAGWWLTWRRLASERADRRERALAREARPTPAGPVSPPAPGPRAAPEARPRPPAALEAVREENARLRRRLAGLTAPRLNPRVVELLPRLVGDALRSAPAGDDASLNTLALPRGLASVTFVLVGAPHAPPGPYAVEIRDAAGAAVWRAAGLRAQPDGGFTLRLPLALIPQGRFTLRVFAGHAGGARLVAQYDVERRPPPP